MKPCSGDYNQDGTENQSTHFALPYACQSSERKSGQSLFPEGFAVFGNKSRSRQSVGRWARVAGARTSLAMIGLDRMQEENASAK